MFGFADSRASLRVPISFDQNGAVNMMEAAAHVLNADGSEKNIDRWIYRYLTDSAALSAGIVSSARDATFRWFGLTSNFSLIVALKLT